MTTLFDKKKNDEEKNVFIGRAWRIDELRLKSSEDLQKLWYVMQKEKLAIISDNQIRKKAQLAALNPSAVSKLRLGMARILTVISERKKVCDEYRRSLEDEYVELKRKEYEEKISKEPEVLLSKEVPEISPNVLKAKFRDLKKGIDNTKYLEEAVQMKKDKETKRMSLDKKYDYKNKKVVQDSDAIEPTETEIPNFKSSFEREIMLGTSMSQEEVLRMHVKNWKMLNLKQRRIVLGFLNAKRAKDAKNEFLKELNLLGQKIAYDNLQKQQNN